MNQIDVFFLGGVDFQVELLNVKICVTFTLPLLEDQLYISNFNFNYSTGVVVFHRGCTGFK